MKLFHEMFYTVFTIQIHFWWYFSTNWEPICKFHPLFWFCVAFTLYLGNAILLICEVLISLYIYNHDFARFAVIIVQQIFYVSCI